MDFSIKAILDKWGEEDYASALQMIEAAEKEGFVTPELLVAKGQLLQLTDDYPEVELSDIEALFQRAAEIDPQCSDAWNEQGYFALNITDDANGAIPLFERAIALQKAALTESVVGMINCLTEIGPPEAASAYLAELWRSLSESSEIRDALAED